MGIPMLKIRRLRDGLFFNMGIPTLVRHLYIKPARNILGKLDQSHAGCDLAPFLYWKIVINDK